LLAAYGKAHTVAQPFLPAGLILALGLVIVAVTLYDLFHSVLMPRPSVARVQFSPTLTRYAWELWRGACSPFALDQREPALAAFGPVILLGLLVVWTGGVILGYGLVLAGLADLAAGGSQALDVGRALWLSAESFLTLGYAGLAPTGALSRLASVVESAIGLGTVAMVVSLLFSLFQAFQRRETLVVDLDATAGSPPSGLQILEACAEPGMEGHLGALLRDWRRWSADVLESHLAYPVLLFFRSSHDGQGWLNSFGAAMDAALLVTTCLKAPEARGEAGLLLRVGTHLTDDLAGLLGLPRRGPPGIEHIEFDEILERLEAAGYELLDHDEAWQTYAARRSRYATPIRILARYLVMPPARWLGDRSYLPHGGRGPVL
jgi:hypothetical protein